YLLTALEVLRGVGLGLPRHALDLIFGETAGGRDGDALLTAGALVLGRNRQNAVGVDIEGHLDLRYPTRRRQYAIQDEAPDALVVIRHRPLALQHVDLDRRLPVGRRAE